MINKKTYMKSLIYLFLFSITVIIGKAQPGSLDLGFGNNGVVITGEGYNYCNAAALQADGKIIQAGSGAYGGAGGFFLIRYLPDGSIDASFGHDGRVVTDFPDESIDEIFSLAVQPDGRIIAGGYTIAGSTDVEVALARYMPDGRPDSSFGINGLMVNNRASDDYVKAIALQADGKILAAGTSSYTESFVFRYLPDGRPDESFGDKGQVFTIFPVAMRINDIAVTPEGKIILGGTYNLFSQKQEFMLVQLLSDGSFDLEFGENGIATEGFDNNMDDVMLYKLTLQNDGKIVTAGTSGLKNSVKSNMTIMRFHINGQRDNLFGQNGKVFSGFGNGIAEAKCVLIQPDDKIVAAGRFLDIGRNYSYFALIRLQPNGITDSSFANNGLQITDIGYSSICNAAVLQTDAKIALAGHSYIAYPQSNKFSLARYNGGDAVLAGSFKEITAEQNTAGITLNWQTVQETNNINFIVERSATAAENSYTSIAEVRGTGAHQYSYTDRLPLAGANYYRIKQAGADGQYSYSATVHIDFAGTQQIKIYPNPAGNRMTVQGLLSGEANRLGLYDMQGKLLQQFSAQSPAFSVDVSRLAAGMYLLRVENSLGKGTYSFVKQ